MYYYVCICTMYLMPVAHCNTYIHTYTYYTYIILIHILHTYTHILFYTNIYILYYTYTLYQTLLYSAKEILAMQDSLQEIVQLVGKESLSEDQKLGIYIHVWYSVYIVYSCMRCVVSSVYRVYRVYAMLLCKQSADIVYRNILLYTRPI